MKQKSKIIRVGIVGVGLIGEKRAEAIIKTKKGKLVAVADPDVKRVEVLARKYKTQAYRDWKKLVSRKEIDVVIVAVPNAFAAPVVLAALKHRKHVLVEKPFGINVKESAMMLAAAKKAKKLIKVGFNHRFHPGIRKAYEIFAHGGIGKILFIRARYGHGGRLGMEKEWRFNKKISGGGELLDQGVHIIDLARWFVGDFKTIYGLAETKFWNTTLDDNTFVLMENKNITVSFHVSTTQWKNLFSFEVFGEKGFLQIDGKGGSYGEEVLTYGKRKQEFGVPEIKIFKFAGGDASWEGEWKNFTSAILGKAKIDGGGEDGLEANKIIEAIYKSSRSGKTVNM